MSEITEQKRDIKNGRKYFEEIITRMIGNNSPYIFYAHIISQCKVKIDYSLPAPAGVNFIKSVYNLYINPALFNKFTHEEKIAIMIHEASHIMYKHVTIRNKKDHKRWNYAGDIAINQQVSYLPKGCLMPEQFDLPKNASAEQYYEALVENEKYKEQQKNEEERKEKLKEKIKEALENGELSEEDFQDGGSCDMEGNIPVDDHSIWEDSEGEDLFQDEVTKRMINKAMVNTKKSRGNIPSDISEILDLFSNKSRVDWRKALRKITGNKKANSRASIKKPNRRFPKRTDLRGKVKDRTFELAVILDVSGSMSDDEIIKGLTEIREICKLNNSDVKIIQVDTEVKMVEDFNKNTRNIKRSGAGGTVMWPGVKYLVENKVSFDALITISDMWIENLDYWEFIPNKPLIFLDTDGTSRWNEDNKYKNVKVFNIDDLGQKI